MSTKPNGTATTPVSRLYDRQIEFLALPLLQHYQEFLNGRRAAQWLHDDSPAAREALVSFLTRLRDEMEELASAYDRSIARIYSLNQKQLPLSR